MLSPSSSLSDPVRNRPDFTWRFSFLLILFCFMFVFVSNDNFNDASDMTIILNKIFLQGIIGGRFFSVFEILFMVIAFQLIRIAGFSFLDASKTEKLLFVSLIVAIFFKDINPNNNSGNTFLGVSTYGITSDMTQIIAFSSLLLIKNKNTLMIFLTYLFRLIIYISLFRAVILFILWAIGKGSSWGYISNMILSEGDTLYIFSFVQILLLFLYLKTKQKRYAITSLFILAVIIISFRRTALFISLLTSLAIGIIYLAKTFTKRKTIYMILFFGIFGMISSNTFSIDQFPRAEKYILRNFGALFNYTSDDWEVNRYVKNDHFEQTYYAVQQAVSTLGFWGYGMDVDYNRFFWYENVSGIHNAFIQVWISQGFIPFLFYSLIFFIILSELIGTLFKIINKYDDEYLLKICVSTYLVVLYLSLFIGYTIHDLVFTKPIIYQTILIAYIFNMNQHRKLLTDPVL